MTIIDMMKTALPAIKGVCFMFAVGIFGRLVDGALFWDVIGFMGAAIGFGVFTYRIFGAQ